MTVESEWLHVRRGSAPLLLSMPHAGTDLRGLEGRLQSAWLARKDADWYVPELYDFASELDATIVRTGVSRTVIDVNRDPTGQSLYPGQNTTDLCPTTTFDGEPLYVAGAEPTAAEIAERRRLYFEPYHATLRREAARLLKEHPRVVVYDCHSIRSEVPRLFEGTLPQFNIGTNSGKSCAPALAEGVLRICKASGASSVLNGRFKGGYITRSFGAPDAHLHAIQMELATRGYLREKPGSVSERDWPPPYEPAHAAPLRDVLRAILKHCISFPLSQD
ncbi:MAG: N-formylglutamate deformylase [Gammaproteobacteria bacterium]